MKFYLSEPRRHESSLSCIEISNEINARFDEKEFDHSDSSERSLPRRVDKKRGNGEFWMKNLFKIFN